MQVARFLLKLGQPAFHGLNETFRRNPAKQVPQLCQLLRNRLNVLPSMFFIDEEWDCYPAKKIDMTVSFEKQSRQLLSALIAADSRFTFQPPKSQIDTLPAGRLS